jgi:glucose-1-phosphate thymidylyltransferase
MKGIVLCGGLGTRLHPLTKVTNKHLLPVYNRPMVYYPIQTLVDAGISEILIVTGGRNAGDFLQLLGNGKDFGLKHLDYTYQEGEGGIAAALSLAEYFVDNEPVCVILGDNVYEKSVRQSAVEFLKRGHGAKIHLKKVENPQRFGVPIISGDRILKIEEKPKVPQSGYAVTGLYMYDHTVFEIIKTLKPSGRGELEITDVNNAYIERDDMTYAVVDGWWSDAGTFDSLLRTNILVASQFEGSSEEISQVAIQTSASILRQQ